MENSEKTEEISPLHKNKVHGILAHSYLFFFIFFLLGLFIHSMIPVEILSSNLLPAGLIFLILGTLLIVWAQRSSVNFKKEETISIETFTHGPYNYTRSPTHYGIFLLMLGFGIMMNSLFILIFSIVSFLITKFIFIKEQERILAEKYGQPYLDYKAKVKI